MKKRLFNKLFLSVAIALVISILLMLVLISVSVNNYFVNDKKQLLTDNCKSISSVLSSRTDSDINFQVGLDAMISVVSDAVLGEAYVCDGEGNVFSCSCDEWLAENSCVHSKGVIPEAVRNEANSDNYFEVGRLNGRFSNTYYTAVTPFYSRNGRVAGYVLISSPASVLQSMWSELTNIYFLCAVIPLTILFIFLYFMTKKITRPVNFMSTAAVKMSKGDFSERIPVSGDDEIAELSKAFNTMSNSLSQLEGMRRSFIANVSHELRTPMTTIGGFIDGILDGTIPPEKHNYYLSVVSVEIKRLSRVVQSMLSLARLESGEQKVNPVKFGLTELACEVMLSQEQRIESKNINIEGLDKGTDITVTADRDLIYQAVFNLVDNAIKFTSENGTISVDVSSDGQGIARIAIRNEGKGIPPNEMQYIFERFYKSDKSRSINKDGTGLGLYITKTIVEIHKGNITVSSIPDSYTEFAITLPINHQ